MLPTNLPPSLLTLCTVCMSCCPASQALNILAEQDSADKVTELPPPVAQDTLADQAGRQLCSAPPALPPSSAQQRSPAGPFL